jgi:ubiquinone/menaquinone biosynthesis C-methylase UbiE
LNLLNKYLFGESKPTVLEPVEAYNLWSAEYDTQTGNLMLDLDERVFSNLLNGLAISGKIVFDVGCGTGRHWQKLMDQEPANLTGFDISEGMLAKLKQKFPPASTILMKDDCNLEVENNSCDILVSTLTIAHIKNIREAIAEWCRVLKPVSDIIITDFHPDALALGALRTFRQNNKTLVINNYVHLVQFVRDQLLTNGFRIHDEESRKVDESVAHYYSAKNAMDLYHRFYGVPVIYGFHLTRP